MTNETLTPMGHRVWVEQKTGLGFVYASHKDGDVIELGNIVYVPAVERNAFRFTVRNPEFISSDTLRAVAELVDQHSKEN